MSNINLTNLIEKSDDTSFRQQAIEKYIDNKKKLQNAVLEYIDNSDEDFDEGYNETSFKKLTEIVNNQLQEGYNEEISEFLKIITNISDNHHRDQEFIHKIINILLYYKDKIKQNLTNSEIYRIFENSKIILLYLLKNQIISITEEIYQEMINKVESNGLLFCYFFYPELEEFIGKDKMISIKNELLKKDQNIFENYEEKRQKGENDSKICSLIRTDSVEEFIAYMNRMNYSFTSEIMPSIFETNSFLIQNKNTTIIEYSAFFGSIQIFKYLFMNEVKLKPSLWLYTIHSKNAELIHFLESNDVSPPKSIASNIDDKNYLNCFIESIKCHHNNIADYIEENLLFQKEIDSKQNEIIFSNCLKYHNFNYLHSDIIDKKYGFYYLCLYNYYELVNLLLKKKENEINAKII